MDGSNNNFDNMNNPPVDETAKNENVTENTTAEVNTEAVNTAVHTEAAASVFDSQPAEQSTQQTQSNFAAFDSQPQANQSYFNYQAEAAQTVMNEEAYAASRSKATVAMVLGIIAVVTSCLCCCLPVCVVLAIISFVLAFKSKKLSPDKKLNGMAIAAIVCSGVALLIYIFIMLYFIILGVGLVSMYNDVAGREELNRILAEYGYELI